MTIRWMALLATLVLLNACAGASSSLKRGAVEFDEDAFRAAVQSALNERPQISPACSYSIRDELPKRFLATLARYGKKNVRGYVFVVSDEFYGEPATAVLVAGSRGGLVKYENEGEESTHTISSDALRNLSRAYRELLALPAAKVNGSDNGSHNTCAVLVELGGAHPKARIAIKSQSADSPVLLFLKEVETATDL